jgi:soluble lytic murein transglycosylase-like protein
MAREERKGIVFKMKKVFFSLFTVIFLIIGCAADRAVNRWKEQEVLLKESSEKVEELFHQVSVLEQSISRLGSEVTRLEKDINALTFRPRLTAYKLPREVVLCGERVPLEDRRVWENLDREFLVALSNEAQMLLYMKRARRYFPYIERRLKESELPDDLKYVTIVESGLRPYAVSPSGASGIWQFIPATGEKYEMRKNKSIDERFDFFKATEGALAYLKSLYVEFQSWPLAMAAYNAGENKIRKEVELQRTTNYFYLDLPLETERYVYKIAVAKIILSDTEKYGLHLEEKEIYDPLRVERVMVELTCFLPLIEVSGALGVTYKEMKEMNPHLLEETIPPGVHYLNLPPETSEKFWSFLSTWEKGLNR